MENAVKIDRRILRTKQSITKSFLELFSEKEFEQITINEIAERANVNRGTVYLHYSDKYDLLDKCIEDHINELISLCKKREANPGSQGMVQEPKPVFDYLRDNFPFFSAMFSNQRAFLFRERLLNFISVNLMDKMERPLQNILSSEKLDFKNFLCSPYRNMNFPSFCLMHTNSSAM
ncbi:TetR/AcrR family transcriptional regulator [Paenibacillus durus]|uniref:TetR/AcrR family transcriptional regulator n=1 Tax=Paenibacillus durus TaxID=44251 RepID=UPI00046FF72E|nr:TetR/AcrR family transcriptional regulator [Paenibacillus durus]